MDLLGTFLSAQRLESSGEMEAAARRYSELISATTHPLPPFDETASAHDLPPAPLIISAALNSLGGLHLEASALDAARGAFRRSLKHWPGNTMSHLNLGDLEREHGTFSKAFSHYRTAAALPLLTDDADDRGWFAEWVAGPREECVTLAAYMCALTLHQTEDFQGGLRYLAMFDIRFRLTPALWRMVNTPLPLVAKRQGGSKMNHVANRADAAVSLCAHAVPEPLLHALQEAFAPSSPFWSETDYEERGYFSFWAPARAAPRILVEMLAQHVLPLTGLRVAGAGDAHDDAHDDTRDGDNNTENNTDNNTVVGFECPSGGYIRGRRIRALVTRCTLIRRNARCSGEISAILPSRQSST